VLTAAGGVEILAVRAELGLGVQRLVTDGEQRGRGDPVAEPVRGHRRGLHVHREGARYRQPILGQRQLQLPVPVRGGVDDPHPAPQLPRGQLPEQERVQRVVRHHRNTQRKHVVEDPVIAHVAGRQHHVTDFLVVAQAGTVPDHQHQVRAQHGQVIGDRLGVGRPHPDVHDGDAGAARKHVVPRGHLASSGIRTRAVRQRGTELLHMPRVVGEQHVPLERFRVRPGVVPQAVDRQRHAFRREQEELLATQVPAGLVKRAPERWIAQVTRFAAGADRDAGTSGGQPAQFPLQVPANGLRAGELALQHRVMRRPWPLYGQPRVTAGLVGRFHGIA
jgi:hypothetical protein